MLIPRKRLTRLTLLGGTLGLLSSALPARLTEARATLLFPQAGSLRSSQTSDGSRSEENPPLTSGGSVVAWAQETLTSKEAVEVLCKRIERNVTQNKEEVLRSACLIPEEGRLKVVALEGNYLQINVAAAKPEIALSLCAGLLAYLNFKTKIPLEDPDGDQLVQAESQLRVQEKLLQKQLWDRLAFNAPPVEAEKIQASQMEAADYQLNLNKYRDLTRTHFFREMRAAAQGPAFVVVEPPYLAYRSRLRVAPILIGATCGAFLSLLIGRQRRNRTRNFVPWRTKETTGARNEQGAQDGNHLGTA